MLSGVWRVLKQNVSHTEIPHINACILQKSYQWVFLNNSDSEASGKSMFHKKCCAETDQSASNYSNVHLSGNQLLLHFSIPVTTEWSVFSYKRLSRRRTGETGACLTEPCKWYVTECRSQQFLPQWSLTSKKISHDEHVIVSKSSGKNSYTSGTEIQTLKLRYRQSYTTGNTIKSNCVTAKVGFRIRN